MRRARDNGILKTEAGKVIGLNLGADYCAEHEWGIKGLRSAFQIPDKGYGLVKRSITTTPKNVVFLDDKKQTVLIVGAYLYEGKVDLKSHYLDRGTYDKDELMTAWDEKSFGINAAKDEDRETVRAIYKAIQENNLSIWLGGGGVFQNAGLVLALRSEIPADKAQSLIDADKDREALEAAAQATGIHAKLEKAGKRYYALSPRWADDKKSSLIFWLNPQEQRDNAFGWFTVADLELWAQNKGPVIEGSDTYKARKGK